MSTLDHRLLALKQTLHNQRADAIRRYWRRPHPQRLLHRLSHATDQAINQLLHEYPLPEGTCCVALGGYGRQEFYPHSDVDLLFLLPAPLKECTAQKRLEHLVAALWDLGLKISQTVQTIPQCLELSAADVTFQTALLEGRYLAGDQSLWHSLQQQHEQQLDPRQFYLKKVAELRARHQNYQNTPYALEPNCKESPGGLRDLQLLGWLARVSGVGKDWAEIAHSGLLTEGEQKAIERVSAAFMRLRIELHLLTGRAGDTLRFDLQPQLAARYGFKEDASGRLGSELLMQRYYWASRLVTQLTTTLLQSFDEQLNPPSDPPKVYSIDAQFAIVNKRLTLKNRHALVANPTNLFKGFLYLQKHEELEGFDALTLRCLWHGRKLVGPNFRNHPQNKALFLKIIQQPQRVYEVLALMNLFNILPRYIPAFRPIVGQMQHDLFHAYTVDQHSLLVVKNLCRFAQQPGPSDPLLAQQLMRSLTQPWRLILAALFHDIAKGQGGAHEKKGAAIAVQFCQAHELNDTDTELIVFLVEHHLLFSHYAQKKDFYHPKVLLQFIATVHSKEKLEALYLLTVADIQATNPKLWTAWKSVLLENLYHLARTVLDDQDAAALITRRRVSAHEALIPQLQANAYAQQLWRNLDEEYFARHQQAVIIWHFQALAHCQSAPFVAVRELPITLGQRSQTTLADPHDLAAYPNWQIMIHAPDQPELFMSLCRVFEQLGVAIQDAQIYTSPKDWVIDTFTIIPTPALLDDEQGQHTVKTQLIEALTTLAHTPWAEATERVRYHDDRSRQARVFPITPKVELQALGATQWTLNIFGTDRRGLLYDVAHVFAQFKLNLRSAKIMTLGERVEDSFVLESERLDDAKQREALSQALFNLL